MVFMETRFDSMEDFVLVVTGLSVDKRRRDGGGRVIAFSEIPPKLTYRIRAREGAPPWVQTRCGSIGSLNAVIAGKRGADPRRWCAWVPVFCVAPSATKDRDPA